MQVETYEVAELIGEQLEDISSPEAIELIEQLGLDGQKELLSVREVGDGDSVVVRNPYQVMTEEEQRVLQLCFPIETPLRDYSASAIPLRVLQVAAHAQQCPNIKRIVVWHPKDAMTDPVLVGFESESRFKAGRVYKLARWGEALLPFEELRAMAQRNLEASLRNSISKGIAELEAFERRLSEAVTAHLSGGNANSPYIHLSI